MNARTILISYIRKGISSGKFANEMPVTPIYYDKYVPDMDVDHPLLIKLKSMNPGEQYQGWGLLLTSTDLSDAFFDNDTIVLEKDRVFGYDYTIYTSPLGFFYFCDVTFEKVERTDSAPAVKVVGFDIEKYQINLTCVVEDANNEDTADMSVIVYPDKNTLIDDIADTSEKTQFLKYATSQNIVQALKEQVERYINFLLRM
jgi:hypothetical protein